MLNPYPINALPYNSLIFNGKGQVATAPDIVIIRLGVQTTGELLTEVQAENAAISNAIIQALNHLGIDDIRTFQYLIDKVYDFQNGTRIDRGYSVQNIFEIRSTQIAEAGTIIDTAVASGANMVEFVSFEISDADLYYKQALNLAVLDATEKAQFIAENNGILNPRIIRITENSSPPIPYSQFFTMREGVAATPIQPGNQQIQAFVTVEFTF